MFSEIRNAAEVILRGGLILYPTDTIWGIGCNALDETAVQAVFRLKRRADSKSLIILLAEPKDIFKYVAAPPPDVVDMISGFERPTTVIYDQALDLPPSLVNKDGSIAIRITKDPFCKRLIKMIKGPLVSTSANLSGMPSPHSFAEVSEAIRNGVDYCVAYRRDEKLQVSPSRIIRFLADGTTEVIRS